jgi:hypothetical protein
MAMTPYPRGSDREENPCIRVSQDGFSWSPFPGCPDPVVPAPAVPSHFADTDLVIHEGELRVYFIVRNKELERTTILCVRSTDGLAWTAPQAVYDAGWAVSPAVARHDDAWYMWFVRTNPRIPGSPSMVLRAHGRDGLTFHDERECDLSIPGHHAWHIDVLRSTTGWEAFVAAYPTGQDMATTRLFHATSADGLAFKVADRPILKPSRWSWDNRMIYRSTAIKDSDGRYRLWYSAASWGERYGIGYLEGQPGAWKDSGHSAPRLRPAKIAQDATGWAQYFLLRRLPPGPLRILRAAWRTTRRA